MPSRHNTKGLAMHLTLNSEDFLELPIHVQEALIAMLSGKMANVSKPVTDSQYEDFDMDSVVDLTFPQIQTWMKEASDKTKLALKVIAKHGPIVDFHIIEDEAGVENFSHFQSRTTIRTRTVTGIKDARLLGFDAWVKGEGDQYVSGHYAVTPITLQSLQRYFKLN
jgi:hypothetical protein